MVNHSTSDVNAIAQAELVTYKAWVKANGHITAFASSVLDAYAAEKAVQPAVVDAMKSLLGFSR
jgi:hypothetical protein